MQPKLIDGLHDIADDYDVFFLDQFGVLHDGNQPYADVVTALQILYAAGKELVVLSNSGKRAAPNIERLVQMGFPLEIFRAVISSGEVAWRGIKDGHFGLPFIAGKKTYIIGKTGDDYGMGDLGLQFVEVPDEADFLLILGSNCPATSLEDYAVLLTSAVLKNIPALCANPDHWMLTRTGLVPAPGAIAKTYQVLGGTVRFIGKPYPDIYQLALSSSSVQDKARIVAIGDSVEHDIRGAADFGISSVLVRTGVLAHATQKDLSNKYKEEQAWPNFVISRFEW